MRPQRRDDHCGDSRTVQLHPNQVSERKKQAIEGLANVFAGKAERSDAAHEAEVKALHEKIGQLTVEREFLARAFGR